MAGQCSTIMSLWTARCHPIWSVAHRCSQNAMSKRLSRHASSLVTDLARSEGQMDFVAAHEGQRGPGIVVHREPVRTAHLVAFRFDHGLQALREPRDFGRPRQAAEGQHGDGVGLDVEQVNPSIRGWGSASSACSEGIVKASMDAESSSHRCTGAVIAIASPHRFRQRCSPRPDGRRCRRCLGRAQPSGRGLGPWARNGELRSPRGWRGPRGPVPRCVRPALASEGQGFQWVSLVWRQGYA